MSASELREHASYLSDKNKLDGYLRALSLLLSGGDKVVLDLGAGTGILGLLAARAGARLVYAVDSGSILGPAADVANRSGLADRVVHVRGRSTEIDLPEPVDVAVCDQIGGFVYDAGVLEYFADVRRRLLAADGVLMPAGFRLFLAAASCGRVRDQVELWRSSPAGFEFDHFADLAVNTEHRVEGNEVRMLSPGVEVARIESDHTGPINGAGEVVIDVAGQCDGLVGFFEAEMGGEVTLTNHPSSSDRMNRWCNFYPFSTGVDVEVGQKVSVQIDVRPLLPAVTWRVKIRCENDIVLMNERHSTLLGQFLAVDDLRRSAGDPISATRVGDAVRRALGLADGLRSTDQVLDEVQAELGSAVWSPSVEHAVRTALLRFTELAGPEVS